MRLHLFDALFFINVLSVLDREYRSILYMVEKLAEGKNSLQGNKLFKEIIKVYENDTDVKELLEKLYIDKNNISQIKEILYSDDALSDFINKRMLDNKYIEAFYENHISAQNILNLQNTFFIFKEENILDLTLHSLFDIHNNILDDINKTYQPKNKKEYETWRMASETLREELINEQDSDDMGETCIEEEDIEKIINEYWTNEYIKEHMNKEDPSPLDFEQIKKFLYPVQYSIQDNIADQINVHFMLE